MNVNKKTVSMDIRQRLSVLWIIVMMNMIFADIYTFMFSGAMGDTPVKVTQVLILIFAIVNEIPIAMIFLSRILKKNTNRWANILASVITILFVIVGGSLTLYYIFFASIEIATMLFIIRYAWRWTNSEDCA